MLVSVFQTLRSTYDSWQMGHVFWQRSHRSMHCLWNSCWHLGLLDSYTAWPGSNFLEQIWHIVLLFSAVPQEEIRTSELFLLLSRSTVSFLSGGIGTEELAVEGLVTELKSESSVEVTDMASVSCVGWACRTLGLLDQSLHVNTLWESRMARSSDLSST